MDFKPRMLHTFPGNIPLPYYMAYPGYLGAEESVTIMKDLEYLQQTYPVQVQKYRKRLSEILDKLDYEGSMIYDEYPDKYQLQRLGKTMTALLMREEPGDAAPADEEHPHTQGAEKEFLEYLVQVLMCDEIYRRRRNRADRERKYWRV